MNPSRDVESLWRLLSTHQLCSSKQLGWIGKGLELQGGAAGGRQKHRVLLPRFSLKADLWLDEKALPRSQQAIAQLFPLLDAEHSSKVASRHLFSIDFIAWNKLLSSIDQMH